MFNRTVLSLIALILSSVSYSEYIPNPSCEDETSTDWLSKKLLEEAFEEVAEQRGNPNETYIELAKEYMSIKVNSAQVRDFDEYLDLYTCQAHITVMFKDSEMVESLIYYLIYAKRDSDSFILDTIMSVSVE